MSDATENWEDQSELLKPDAESGFVVDIDGFEGPLDLLLALARTQKVDLAKVSVLQLAEQYLRFIDELKKVRLEVAADYLVMAAWLAYLKSRLLLPEPEEEGAEDTAEMAELLAFRLRRLDAMREAAKSLVNRNRLGREIFARGAPEPVLIVKKNDYAHTLYELLTAYATQRQRQSVSHVTVAARKVWSLQEAKDVLSRLIGVQKDWGRLDDYLITYLVDPDQRVTALASSFSASLELVREGAAEIRQSDAFAPIYIRKRGADDKKTPDKQ